MLKQIDDSWKWSFSRLETYHSCPYSFLLQYMQDPPLPRQGNAWAEYGTLCHALLEEYGNGTLTADSLANEYAKRYEQAVVHNFPPVGKNYAEKAYQQGLDYFTAFKGFGEGLEVVSTEEKFEFNIGPYPFVGISDLVLRKKDTGKLLVWDHKTKSASTMAKDRDSYTRQLYIYAEHVFRKYGEYPEEMAFNMLKTQEFIREPFSMDKLNETKQWVEDTIDEIFFENEWKACTNYFKCRYICDVFEHCEEGQAACSRRK